MKQSAGQDNGQEPENGRGDELRAGRYRVLVINGPNLNLLGARETGIYGSNSLQEIHALCLREGEGRGASVSCFQSNHEGALVDRIQAASGQFDLIVINPAAYTHTSVAIRDALLAVGVPVIEVHLSNVYRREPFRRHSYISDIAVGQIVGFGADGYRCAIELGINHLERIHAQAGGLGSSSGRGVSIRPGRRHREVPPRSVI